MSLLLLLLVDIGDSVMVVINTLLRMDFSVFPVPTAEQNRRQNCGKDGSGQNGDLRVIVGGATESEAEFTNEQRNGETDAR